MLFRSENTAVEGGAINAAGITSVSNSNFTDNVAQSFTNAILYRSGEILYLKTILLVITVMHKFMLQKVLKLFLK